MKYDNKYHLTNIYRQLKITLLQNLICVNNYNNYRTIDEKKVQIISDEFPPIIIYQMGKVGSKTILRSLEKANIKNFIGHAHSLTWTNINQDNHQNIDTQYRQFLRQLIDKYSGSIRFKVISLVRDPVASFISNLFHNYKNYLPDLKRIDRETAIRNIKSCLLKNFCEFDEQRDYICSWFDVHFRDVFSFDIFSVKFNTLKSYQIYSTKYSDLLIIKLEDLEKCHKQAFDEFLNISNFTLFPQNIGSSKWYADLYRQTLSQINIPEHLLDKIYSSRYSQHFYSEKELLNFRIKWTHKVSNIDNNTLSQLYNKLYVSSHVNQETKQNLEQKQESITLDSDIKTFVEKIAEHKNTDKNKIVNMLIRNNKTLLEQLSQIHA